MESLSRIERLHFWSILVSAITPICIIGLLLAGVPMLTFVIGPVGMFFSGFMSGIAAEAKKQYGERNP